jgi:hypothetical protein
VLHEFAGGDDGTDPYAGLLLDKHGNLFGVSAEGGGTGCYGNGCGVVFEMKHAGTAYSESVLHAFRETDGSAPGAALVFGKHGVRHDVERRPRIRRTSFGRSTVSASWRSALMGRLHSEASSPTARQSTALRGKAATEAPEPSTN